jgi:hypothetical protein
VSNFQKTLFLPASFSAADSVNATSPFVWQGIISIAARNGLAFQIEQHPISHGAGKPITMFQCRYLANRP